MKVGDAERGWGMYTEKRLYKDESIDRAKRQEGT